MFFFSRDYISLAVNGTEFHPSSFKIANKKYFVVKCNLTILI